MYCNFIDNANNIQECFQTSNTQVLQMSVLVLMSAFIDRQTSRAYGYIKQNWQNTEPCEVKVSFNGLDALHDTQPTVSQTNTHLTVSFAGHLGKSASERLNQSGFLLEQEWGSSSVTWTICKSSAPHSRQITTPALHHSIFYRLDAFPDDQPTASKHCREFQALTPTMGRSPNGLLYPPPNICGEGLFIAPFMSALYHLTTWFFYITDTAQIMWRWENSSHAKWHRS